MHRQKHLTSKQIVFNSSCQFYFIININFVHIFDLANEYVLEKLTEPGVPINLESSLESMGTREFCLVRFGRK